MKGAGTFELKLVNAIGAVDVDEFDAALAFNRPGNKRHAEIRNRQHLRTLQGECIAQAAMKYGKTPGHHGLTQDPGVVSWYTTTKLVAQAVSGGSANPLLVPPVKPAAAHVRYACYLMSVGAK